ncbi:hypothetical protein P3342_009070 [Pyrenophora teres f. teres]|nr:hypothetical protein P3342_009070 [Pyrenophora teres f. teres]
MEITAVLSIATRGQEAAPVTAPEAQHGQQNVLLKLLAILAMLAKRHTNTDVYTIVRGRMV